MAFQLLCIDQEMHDICLLAKGHTNDMVVVGTFTSLTNAQKAQHFTEVIANKCFNHWIEETSDPVTYSTLARYVACLDASLDWKHTLVNDCTREYTPWMA